MYSQFFNPFGFWQNAMSNYTNKVTKLAMEATDSAVKQQVASGQHYIENASKHMCELMNSKAPEDFFKIQAAWFQETFEQMQKDTEQSFTLFQETSGKFNKITKDSFGTGTGE